MHSTRAACSRPVTYWHGHGGFRGIGPIHKAVGHSQWGIR